jgi:carbon monoxide dehydrogenase subunit G
VELTHRFTVPAPVEETWATFNDIEGVAGCFPGATVTSVEGDTFQGSCKVKLGPIALVYNGSGTFLDKDETNHSMKIEAKGKDKRGNGTAGANVTARMTGSGDSTDVVVVTDLSITGKPAQFGRGVMQDVSDKLLGQFVACVERKLGGGDQETAEPAAAAAPAASSEPAPPTESAPTDSAAPPSDPAPAPLPPPTPQPATDDALDLGATVLPVLAKTYWRQALGALLVLAFLIRAIRRRS